MTGKLRKNHQSHLPKKERKRYVHLLSRKCIKTYPMSKFLFNVNKKYIAAKCRNIALTHFRPIHPPHSPWEY